MSSFNAKEFFKQQKELMNLSDDDRDERYVARMTGNKLLNEKEDVVMIDLTEFDNVQYTSTPATSCLKRKTTRSIPFPSSPRIKRSKIAPNLPSVELDAQSTSYHIDEDATTGDVTPHARSGALHKKRKTPESLASQASQETIIIDDDDEEPFLKAKSTPPLTVSDSSMVRSSPIDDTSNIFIVVAPKNTEQKKSVHVEAKHAANRKTIRKPIPVFQLQQPRVDPANETSIIDDFSTSSPSSSNAPSPVSMAQSKPRKSTIGSASAAAPKLVKEPSTTTSSSSIAVAVKKLSTTAKGKGKAAGSSSIVAAPKLATKLSTTAKGKGKGKAKDPSPEKLSVFVYTVQAQAEADAAEAEGKKTITQVQFLKGFTFFHFGFDFNSKMASGSTRTRINKILLHGGRVIPKYDSSKVTHILTERKINKSVFLRAVGVDELSQIPEHIPIIEWAWVVKMMEWNPSGNTEIRQVELFNYGVFSDRLPPTSASSSLQARQRPPKLDSSVDFSHISDFSTNNIQPDQSTDVPVPPHCPAPQQRRTKVAKTASSRVPLHFQSEAPAVNKEVVDPLEEFYKGGTHLNEYDSETDAEDVVDDQPVKKKKRGWLCKQPDMNHSDPCPNQDIVEKLEELQTNHAAKPGEDDHWRAFSYRKSIPAIRQHPKRITSFAEALEIEGVGEKTAHKVMEIIETGDLQRIYYERTEAVQVATVFTQIYGVGQQTALKWYQNGCRTLNDLLNGKGGVKLSENQKLGIKFYDDLKLRMPREEAKAIFGLIKPIALRIDPKLYIEIMGSYRRGKATCGDIDILITRCPNDGRTHEGVLPVLLAKLHAAGILTEDLALPNGNKTEENPLEAVYHGLCRLPNVEGARRRRIDFLTVPWSSKGGALLYYTGDDYFNRSMRLLANKKGFSLNQRGLYEGVIRDPSDRKKKLSAGNLIASDTEEQIFEMLGVPWREPQERVTHYQDLVERAQAEAEEEEKKANNL